MSETAPVGVAPPLVPATVTFTTSLCAVVMLPDAGATVTAGVEVVGVE